MKKSFASDNNSGVHPIIMEAIQKANHGHVKAYGDDIFTKSAMHFSLSSLNKRYLLSGTTIFFIHGMNKFTRFAG